MAVSAGIGSFRITDFSRSRDKKPEDCHVRRLFTNVLEY
jgi:hypothetical protein